MPLPMNGPMPFSALQLIMQLAANNPDAAAQLMAGTGAQPPEVPTNAAGNRMTGVPAMGATPSAQMAGGPAAQGLPAPPVPPQLPQPPAPDLGQALAGVVPPTQAPGPETLPAPGAPQPGQVNGQLGNVTQLMQMLMAAAQKPTDRLSLGRAIQGA